LASLSCLNDPCAAPTAWQQMHLTASFASRPFAQEIATLLTAMRMQIFKLSSLSGHLHSGVLGSESLPGAQQPASAPPADAVADARGGGPSWHEDLVSEVSEPLLPRSAPQRKGLARASKSRL
jgi:hypothetical protein